MNYYKGSLNGGESEIWIPNSSKVDVANRFQMNNKSIIDDCSIYEKICEESLLLTFRRFSEFKILLLETQNISLVEQDNFENRIKKSAKLNSTFLIGFTALEAMINFYSYLTVLTDRKIRFKNISNKYFGTSSEDYQGLDKDEYNFLICNFDKVEVKYDKSPKGRLKEIIKAFHAISKKQIELKTLKELKSLTKLRNAMTHVKPSHTIDNAQLIVNSDIYAEYISSLKLGNLNIQTYKELWVHFEKLFNEKEIGINKTILSFSQNIIADTCNY